MTPGKSDRELVEGYLRGDTDAFKYVDKCIAEVIRGWRDRLGYLVPAVVSDTHLEVLEALRRGDFAYRGNLNAFVRRITIRNCIDYTRGEKWKSRLDADELELPDPRASADGPLLDREQAWFYFRVLRKLPRACIDMWRMELQEHLSRAEIGQRMAKLEGRAKPISAGAVGVRIYECRKKAKEIREKLLKGHNVSGPGSPKG